MIWWELKLQHSTFLFLQNYFLLTSSLSIMKYDFCHIAHYIKILIVRNLLDSSLELNGNLNLVFWFSDLQILLINISRLNNIHEIILERKGQWDLFYS